jgi:hypothetical protein
MSITVSRKSGYSIDSVIAREISSISGINKEMTAMIKAVFLSVKRLAIEYEGKTARFIAKQLNSCTARNWVPAEQNAYI